jgi:hypothetical protein
LLLVLAIRPLGAPITKTDGKYQGIWGWDKNYPTFIGW